jgi:hypothetical protein
MRVMVVAVVAALAGGADSFVMPPAVAALCGGGTSLRPGGTSTPLPKKPPFARLANEAQRGASPCPCRSLSAAARLSRDRLLDASVGCMHARVARSDTLRARPAAVSARAFRRRAGIRASAQDDKEGSRLDVSRRSAIAVLALLPYSSVSAAPAAEEINPKNDPYYQKCASQKSALLSPSDF